jgi:uncharacterized membrane protein YvbJ
MKKTNKKVIEMKKKILLVSLIVLLIVLIAVIFRTLFPAPAGQVVRGLF